MPSPPSRGRRSATGRVPTRELLAPGHTKIPLPSSWPWPMRPNVAFGASNAPNATFAAWNGGWARSVSVEGGGGGKEWSTQCHIGALDPVNGARYPASAGTTSRVNRSMPDRS
ncbi:hypothetical protein GCM10023192_17490 [Amycolatopsis samaneae]